MLEFFRTTFRKDIRPNDVPPPEPTYVERPGRETALTEAEAHVFWLAGYPYVRIREADEDEPRFVSLLVPFY